MRRVERLAAAIQFAANGTATGVSLHLKRNSDADVTVVGMCIDIGLEVVGKIAEALEVEPAELLKLPARRRS